MALAFTMLLQEGFATDATNFTTAASASPTANAGLLLLIQESSSTLTGDPTITTGFTITGSWNQEAINTESGHRTMVYSAYASASPGSGTLDVAWGATRTGQNQALVQVTGQHASDFVLQPASELMPTDTACNKSLAGALANSESAIFSVVGNNLNELHAPAGGETEVVEVGHASPNRRLHAIYQINDTNASHDWTNSANQTIQIVMEIAAAAAAGGSKPKSIALLGVG